MITADDADLTTCKASLSRSIHFYNPPSGSNDWYSSYGLENNLLIIYPDADSLKALTKSVLVYADLRAQYEDSEQVLVEDYIFIAIWFEVEHSLETG